MELKFLKKTFGFILLLFWTAHTLAAQELSRVKTTTTTSVPTTVSTVPKTHDFLLKRLIKNGVGYLQILEDNVVLVQIIEDSIISMKRIIDEDILIRYSTKNNQKNIKFLKDTEVLKSIVEDHVLLLKSPNNSDTIKPNNATKSIVEDHVLLLKSPDNSDTIKPNNVTKSIVEDHVLLLKSKDTANTSTTPRSNIVEDHVLLLKSKDTTNTSSTTPRSNIVEDHVLLLKSKDSTNLSNPSISKQINTDTLKKVRRDSLKRANAVHHLSIGISGGFINVPGIDVAYKFRSHWTARLGYGYLDYEKNNYTYTRTSTDATGKIDKKTFSLSAAVHFSNISGLLEYGIGQKGRLRLVAGAAYFPKKTLTVSGEMLTEFQFSAAKLNPIDLGSGSVEVGFASKISPYVGMGIGRATPRRRLNLSIDFGAYYLGDYRINIHVKPGLLLKENEQNAPIIQRNLNAHYYYKILPAGNLRLAYRLY